MEYITVIRELMEIVEKEEAETIKKAAVTVADAVSKGNSVYTFGASHAGILSEELFYRAGGLAIFNPIFGKEIMLDNFPVTHTSRMEMLEGYGTLLAKKTAFKAGDVLIVHSVSGRNPSSIDLVMEAKKQGVSVISITNLTYSKSVSSRSASGKKLYELSDIVIDNHGCIGDACLAIEALAQKVAPTSTVIGCLIVNMMAIEITKLLIERGVSPVPVFYSANLDGGSEQNEKILSAYKDQIHYM